MFCEWVEHYISEGVEVIYIANDSGDEVIQNAHKYSKLVQIVELPAPYRKQGGTMTGYVCAWPKSSAAQCVMHLGQCTVCYVHPYACSA